jgi:hypothetical protein
VTIRLNLGRLGKLFVMGEGKPRKGRRLNRPSAVPMEEPSLVRCAIEGAVFGVLLYGILGLFDNHSWSVRGLVLTLVVGVLFYGGLNYGVSKTRWERERRSRATRKAAGGG